MSCTCFYMEVGDRCFTCLEKLEEKACRWLGKKGIQSTVQKTVLCKCSTTSTENLQTEIYLPATSVASAMGWNEWMKE